MFSSGRAEAVSMAGQGGRAVAGVLSGRVQPGLESSSAVSAPWLVPSRTQSTDLW